MRSTSSPLVGLAVTIGVAVVAVLALRVPSGEVTETPEPSVTTTLPGGVVTNEGTTPTPSGSVTVVGSGDAVDQSLQGNEYAFLLSTNVGVDVVALNSDSEVWELVENPRLGVDVIEVGFRLEALADLNGDAFLPVDTELVPNLANVADDLRLDTRGIIPRIDAALGLFVTAEADPIGTWEDLALAAEGGATVVMPAPPTDLAVVFVWALGDGDPVVGLERYEELLTAGVTPLRSTNDVIELADAGPVIGAWSSSGVVRVDRRVDTEFVVPEGGAVALPGFSGVLASSDDPDLAYQWLDFRLNVHIQNSMTFSETNSGFGEEGPVPVIPVLDVGVDARPFTAFDPHFGDEYRTFDWPAVAASAAELREALTALVSPEEG